MGLKFKREKKRVLLLSLLYRLAKINPLSREKRLKLYLDLTWIFDRFAHSEAMAFYPIEKNPVRTNTLNFLQPLLKKEYTVLDIGCSKGDLTNLIAKNVRSMVGIDHDELAIKSATENYGKENLKFINGDALEHVKLIDSKYNIIVLSHILEHIENPKSFLGSYLPFAKFIYVEVPDYEKTYHNIFRNDVNASLQYTDDDHVSEFDRDELLAIFKSLNLRVIQSEYRNGVMRFFLDTSFN